MAEDSNQKVQSDQNEDQKDFDRRLRDARNEIEKTSKTDELAGVKYGKTRAIQIGTELVVAVAVGGLIGFLIDSWLGTKPWFLIGFLFLGNAAGLWNIFRLTSGQSYSVGFKNKRPLDSNKKDH